MIVAQRDDNIFLSDEIGVIDLNRGTHAPVSVEAAMKFGYWEQPTGDRLAEAREYEARELRR